MRFKKGNIPWNKGKGTGLVPRSAFKKGHKTWNKGIPHNDETKRKVSETKKRLYREGKIKVWNKGKKLPPLSKEHRGKISKANTGRKVSEETRRKSSETRKQLYKEGKLKNWNEGLTKETDERLRIIGIKTSKTLKKLHKEGKLKIWKEGKKERIKIKCEECKKVFETYPYLKDRAKFCSQACCGKYISKHPKGRNFFKKGHILSEEIRKKMREAKLRNPTRYWKGKHPSKEHMQKLHRGHKRAVERGVFNTETHKKKLSKSLKHVWQNPEFKEQMIKKTLKGLIKRPTKPEKQFIEFIQKHNLPFSYCGNGTLIIGYKCPDFYENNGKKICIEISNKKFRKYRYNVEPQEYEEKRIEHFKNFGWKCLVVWQEELKNERVLLNRVRNFLGGVK